MLSLSNILLMHPKSKVFLLSSESFVFDFCLVFASLWHFTMLDIVSVIYAGSVFPLKQHLQKFVKK